MGSEGESSDLNSPVYVAVGRNLKEGKSLLSWAVESFEGRSICLVHVHQPMNLVSLLNGKLSASKFKNQAIKACQEFERLKMQKLMNQYLLFLSQMGKQADKISIEMREIEKGILQLIIQQGIRLLIMGATPETFNSKKLSETNCSKAMVVCQQAPVTCHIWFISKGSVVHERPAGLSSHLTTTMTLLPSRSSSGGTALTCDSEEYVDVDAEHFQYLDHGSSSTENIVSMKSPNTVVGQISGYGLPLFLKPECPEHPQCSSSSSTSQDSKFQETETSDLHNKLENAMIDAENAKKSAFEESLKRRRAEEDALDAVRKAEAAESLCEEEINISKEIEELLHRQRVYMETMKIQHEQCLRELELIQEQKPVLESQLREACCSEKELEEKIIQAVNLLITFKGERDNLQIESDSAIRKVNKYRSSQMEDSLRKMNEHFFGISFADIIKATQNFQPDQKIGEGRYGSVFKGMLGHVKVAIKMLPSSGSQSDSEFKNEVEVLCRVRHPNLVTLIGACPESRSLIYGYVENGSLQDYLLGRAKTSTLSWQTRIRIAIEICTVLMFLHANDTCSVHGDLRPSNILLDTNFVTKISDFGIYNMISQSMLPFSLRSKNDPESSAYIDPDFLENGELTMESDVYSFGVVLLQLLTSRPAVSVMRDVKCALEGGNLETVLDVSAGDWPIEEANELAHLGLRCCKKDRLDQPDLDSEVWGILEPLRELCNSSEASGTQHKVPSHFVCPIFQEVMEDPHIAGDGFTYEGDAIKGWFNSGHNTSPMTNLNLDNCDLIPNYALYYAIQEWHQNT